MTHGSLFSGIGGFDLAAQWMGWENKFHCEWNEFGQKVLHHYWPQAKLYGDITKSDFNEWKGRIDVLSGGFPCQPYSAAGKRLGKEDDRHLWPEMLRAIREISPRWVVGENVRGLTNWNGGVVFDEVQADLEAAGYEVTPFLLPSCAVNAPHRRDRIWFIAHAESQRINGIHGNHSLKEGENREWFHKSDSISNLGVASDTDNGSRPQQTVQARREKSEEFHGSSRITSNPISNGQPGQEHGEEKRGWTAKESIPDDWQDFPTQSPVCSRNDGVPGGLAGITVPKHRNESIKGYGNAVVPQVVYQIFKSIEQYEQ